MSDSPTPPPPPQPPPPIPPTPPADSSQAPRVQTPERVGSVDLNVAAALGYLPIVAVVWLVLEPYNKQAFLRFHAIQSLGLAVVSMGASMFLGSVPFLGWIVLILLTPVLFVVWVICAVKAFQYEWFKLPFLGDFAEQQAKQEGGGQSGKAD